MHKLISQTALRKQLGEALRPIRIALHETASGAHSSVEFMGYRFTGSRLEKGRGQIGPVWKADYSGEPVGQTSERWPVRQFGCVGGSLDDCASQLHSRLRKEYAESAIARTA